MRREDENASIGGVGFGSILFFIFLVLKLTGVISWSWLWVIAPLWIGFAVTILILAILFIVYMIKGD